MHPAAECCYLGRELA